MGYDFFEGIFFRYMMIRDIFILGFLLMGGLGYQLEALIIGNLYRWCRLCIMFLLCYVAVLIA
jgi:hypothetical protein